jgi:hypothetical protein
MVSGPASSPASVSFLRSSMINSMVWSLIAVGLVLDLRERGSNAVSPSSR